MKASGKKPLDKDDKAMLENAKIILNKEQTHSIIANLIYHRFNRNFWLGETNKTKFLVGGKEAWHIMLTRNWKNKISGELATAFRAMCKEKLIRDDELLKKCKKKELIRRNGNTISSNIAKVFLRIITIHLYGTSH